MTAVLCNQNRMGLWEDRYSKIVVLQFMHSFSDILILCALFDCNRCFHKPHSLSGIKINTQIKRYRLYYLHVEHFITSMFTFCQIFGRNSEVEKPTSWFTLFYFLFSMALLGVSEYHCWVLCPHIVSFREYCPKIGERPVFLLGFPAPCELSFFPCGNFCDEKEMK
jgi:hypothetical protein